ncbi:MAG: transporter substrate-binding domain-containing protein, partial [Gammaproteobacteria bacterium]|nr:transporter substrate-binding domain-containing protein [Gammaproteobacteria bacterium]
MEFSFLILELLGIPLSKQRLIAVDHETYGAKTNGTWHGVIRQIMDGEFHTSLPAFTPLAERAEVVDFTYPVMENNLVFLTRKPSGSSAISINPLKVFQPEVWLMTIAVAVAVAGILIIEQLLSHSLSIHSQKNFLLTVPQKFLDAIMVFTGKGSLETHTKTKMPTGKISLGVWALSMVVFASLYSGAILVSLVKPKDQTVFKDIPSLTRCIIRGKCFIFVDYKDSSVSLSLTSDRQYATS